MPCPRYITGDVSHEMCVFWMGGKHARLVLEGADYIHCKRFNIHNFRSRLALPRCRGLGGIRTLTYSTVVNMLEYGAKPRVEETLAGYLSLASA